MINVDQTVSVHDYEKQKQWIFGLESVLIVV
jgi:hypothetical protein